MVYHVLLVISIGGGCSGWNTGGYRKEDRVNIL